jgi:hypothetical protein
LQIKLDLSPDPAVAQECPRINIEILHIIVFEPRCLDRLQEMDRLIR